jgi:hypothetical protein
MLLLLLSNEAITMPTTTNILGADLMLKVGVLDYKNS